MPDEVISEIASAIRVRHIQTPIEAARIFTRASQADAVAAHMEQHNHDATPVFPSETDRSGSESGDPDGTLWKADLKRLSPTDEVRSVVRPLTGSALIDANAGLGKLLDRFRNEHRFMLVVGGHGLEGIVTPSDMNKQAGRTHLFMQICALEIGLSDRVRAADRPEVEVLLLLPRTRAGQAKARLKRKQVQDDAADLVAALDFQDLLVIHRARTELGTFADMSDRQIREVADFRNSVMHAVLEPAGDASERLDNLLNQTALIARLLDELQETARAA